MRRVTLIAGGVLAAVTVGALTRHRLRGRGQGTSLPDDDAIFTVFAPGGKYAYWCNGPGGWLTARLIPVLEAGVHDAAASMLDLRPEHELLDIGCGPGVFLANKASHVRRVVGLDTSPLMLREAGKRLADRLAAGTARLVLGNAAELPFEDGEFSAVTAIFAPLKASEAFRVLRPGGRLVFADQDPRRSPDEPTSTWGVRRYDEANYRRMADEAGFTDLSFGYEGKYLLLSGRKPVASPGDEAGVQG